MLVTRDNATLIVAESYGIKLTPSISRTTAASRTDASGLSSETASPDGICLDEENAVWYGGVPNRRCVGVREGGEVLQTIEVDRGCLACAVGGADRRTLFMMATE
jgi:sugar lactone lactonase YvrE